MQALLLSPQLQADLIRVLTAALKDPATLSSLTVLVNGLLMDQDVQLRLIGLLKGLLEDDVTKAVIITELTRVLHEVCCEHWPRTTCFT